MTAIIYRPARNAMQSGKGKTKEWVLVFERETPREIEPLMGYTSSSDMKSQIRLTFESREEAESYAKRNGIPYQVQKPHDSSVKRTAYTDNFRHDRKGSWTH
ncbi:MAG: ETC complex I subunit [Hyphomicrobiaceae bacterium]|nr:ETC complex I subunit [Hyphomicrobiaceae bacterium]